MLDKVEIQRIVDKIVASEYYEGDYGDVIDNEDLVLSNVEEFDRENVPKDYLDFLKIFGFGELDPAFYIDDGLSTYSSICGRNIEAFEGVYIFAGNSGEILYGFDSQSHWAIVELSAELDRAEVVCDDFSTFILNKLKYLEGLVDWRANN